jgi:hypothetical protein
MHPGVTPEMRWLGLHSTLCHHGEGAPALLQLVCCLLFEFLSLFNHLREDLFKLTEIKILKDKTKKM